MEAGKSIINRFYIVLIFMLVFSCLSQRNLLAGNQETWDQLTEQANTQFEQEQYEQAVGTAVEALTYANRHFGKEEPRTIFSMYTLGRYYNDLGNPEPALPLLEEACRLSIKVSGENNSDTVMIMISLAELYGILGQYENAKPFLEKALKYQQNESGTNDPDTLATMITLAQIYEALGIYRDATKLLIQAGAAYEASAGADHSDTLFTRESLAAIYEAQGQFETAREILEDVYQRRIAVQGEKNQETIISMGSLAELYRKTGNYEESETLFQQAIALFREVAGEQDPDLFMTYGNLAQLYQDRGRYLEAEKLYMSVWKYDLAELGEKHPNTIIDLNNLAGIYRLQGEYGKAEKTYLESLALLKDVLGDKHPETISVMNNLALLFENQGVYEKAEPVFKTALRYSKEISGKKHPTSLALMNNLASLYESQGVFKKSEPLYQKAILLNKEVYGPDHPNTIASVNNLGYLFLIQQEFSKAEPLFQKVLKLWQTQLGENHQKTLKSLNNLARVYHKLGKTDQAETMFVKALQLRKDNLGEKHPDVIRSMIDLSALYHTLKKYEDAATMLTRTIILAEEILGEKHQYTFEALNNLADLYESTEEIQKALEIRQKVFDRRSVFFDRVLWAAGENTRQSYIELHKPEQDKFLKLLIKLNNKSTARTALHTSLQRKGLLLKITSEIHKIVEFTDSPELSTQAKALHEKRKQLASLTLSGPTTETPTQFRKTVVQLENELEELQAAIGRASLIYHMTSKSVSVDNVFNNMEMDDVLIDYITYKDKTLKMLAVIAQTDPRDCFVWWKCVGNKIELVPLGELESIRESISIFRETIQDEDSEEEDIIDTGHDIYKKIWEPLQSYIGDKTSIYIVPDSALHLLPFDALVDENDSYLIEYKDLKILSSSRDLVVSAFPDAQGEFVILAGPDYDLEDKSIIETKQVITAKRGGIDRGMRISHGLRSLSFEPLIGAEIEGKTIKKVSDAFAPLEGAEDEGRSISQAATDSREKSTIYIKKDAEEQQLRNLGKSPKMLHIATHGFFLQAEERLKKRLLSLQRGGPTTLPPPGDNPLLRAGLAFAGINSNAPFLGEIDTDNDGVLTALEVLSLRLSGTQLVVLSACETGVGEIHAGEGVYGLRRAFQEAGVKSVVNSLWPVSDEGTRRLMTTFYQNIYKGMPPRKALKAAQLSLLQSEWNSPYYWSAFVLVERRFSANL